MLSVVNRSGGGGSSGKSLVLATNPEISIKSESGQLIVTWSAPTTEIAIKQYNIYVSETQPTSLKSMTKKGSTTGTSYTLTGLVNDKTYYIAVESVSVEGYENASLRKVVIGTPSDHKLILSYNSKSDQGINLYYSVDKLNFYKVRGFDSTSNLVPVTTPVKVADRYILYCKEASYNNLSIYQSFNGLDYTKLADLSGIVNIYNPVYSEDRILLTASVSNAGDGGPFPYYSVPPYTTVVAASINTTLQYSYFNYDPIPFKNTVSMQCDYRTSISTSTSAHRVVISQDKGLSYELVNMPNSYSTSSSQFYSGFKAGSAKVMYQGAWGKCVHSYDGVKWSNMNSYTSETNSSSPIAYGDGRIIISGYKQTQLYVCVYSLENSTSWVAYPYNNICVKGYGGSRFIGMDYGSGASTGNIMELKDGSDSWSRVTSTYIRGIDINSGAIYVGDRFIFKNSNYNELNYYLLDGASALVAITNWPTASGSLNWRYF